MLPPLIFDYAEDLTPPRRNMLLAEELRSLSGEYDTYREVFTRIDCIGLQ